MKGIATAFLGILLLVFAACSGGAKGPAESSDDKTLTESESTLVDPDKTPSPEITLEVINTVLK